MSKVVRRVTSDEAVLTFAILLPNAIGGGIFLPNATDRFLCLYASIDYVKGINLGSPRVPDSAKLCQIVPEWDNTNPRYRTFAPSFAKSTLHRVHNRTCSGGESGGTSR